MRTSILSTMQTAAALLSRRPHRRYPEVTLGDVEIAFRLGRVHELCGPARRTLALACAARLEGPVVWISQTNRADALCPDGVADLIPPGKLLFVAANKRDDVLWAMEESLRDGRAPTVIADLSAPPPMVPVRRLHLAAEAGSGAGVCQPLALLLTPEDGGAPGIETRWSLHPAHHTGVNRWRLNRLRARMAPPRQWMMAFSNSGLAPCSDIDTPQSAAPEPARTPLSSRETMRFEVS